MRAELEHWLRAVGARKVTVAFDEEDKTGKPLAKRHDAHIYARFLSEDLHRKMGLNATKAMLPVDWRTDGKADWDGALAKLWRQG
jgi:hypothetical protein